MKLAPYVPQDHKKYMKGVYSEYLLKIAHSLMLKIKNLSTYFKFCFNRNLLSSN